MLISLYILNYNYGHFLAECLKSVEQQSDTAFEVILVDNGSSDGSRDFLAGKAAHHNWKFLEFSNITLGAVGNRVMEVSTGNYIVRLDADDILSLDFISKMKALIEKEAPDLAFGNFYYIDGRGHTFGTHTCLPRGRGNDRSYHDEPVHGACTLIKIDSFKNKGGYDEDFLCQDGFDLYMKMRSMRIALLDDYCFYYRKGHRSLSSTKQRLFTTRNKIIERRFRSEGIKSPDCCNVLIIPSGFSSLSSPAVERVIAFAEQASGNAHGPMAIVLGAGDDETGWPKIGFADYWHWQRDEELSVSSRGLIARISHHYRTARICSVNLGEAVAPVEYISAASRYSMLMETDGAITGTRFDQSLFRPIPGGVSQVSHENALKDVDRWVVHTGGITCVTPHQEHAERVFSLLEVEVSALSNIIDGDEENVVL